MLDRRAFAAGLTAFLAGAQMATAAALRLAKAFLPVIGFGRK